MPDENQAPEVVVNPGDVPAPAEPVDAGNEWTKKGALIVANGSIPAGEKRMVIVCETRSEDGSLDEKRKYPAGAAIYFRHALPENDGADFGDRSPIVTLGVDVQQGVTAGFSDHPAYLNVGPSSPIYAAANLAYLQGARDIRIAGATDAQKTQLQQWFAMLLSGKEFRTANSTYHGVDASALTITFA